MDYGQITLNNQRSFDDYGFIITDLEIGQPSPNLNLVSIPYLNGVYDFSNASGETTYTTRDIRIVFSYDKYEMFNSRLTAIYYDFINYLNSVQDMSELKIDFIQGTFEARVYSVSNINLFEEELKIEVTLIAQPFRKFDTYEGNDEWDLIDFDYDYFQDVEFEVINNDYEKKIQLNNISITRESPQIEVKGNVYMKFKGFIYKFNTGTYSNVIKLEKGMNDIILYGVGTIKFLFKKEMI